MVVKLRSWFEDRFGLKPIQKAVLDRRVAKSPWYYGDGATLFLLLGVLVATGAFMTLTYVPSPDAAYASVRYITEHQRLGWFVRGLHYWSAGLMMVMLFFHFFRILLVGGYKFPREGTYLIGVLLFFGVLIMSFTGYLLRWDERAIHAIQVVLHMFYRVPWIGEELVLLVQGGGEPGALTLTRLYSVHVIFVPLLLAGLVFFHLYLVILHGVTSKPEKQQPIYSAEQQKKLYKETAASEEGGEDFYPNTAAASGAMALVVLLVVLLLTLVLGPAPLFPEANLVEPSFPIEEWWYWWYSSLIALLPSAVAPSFVVVFPVLAFILMVLLPLVDRGPYRGLRKRPFMVGFVILSVLLLIFLSDLRRTSPWTAWPDASLPPVPPGVTLTDEAEQGRELYVEYGCNSCHAVGGFGRQVGTDLADMDRRYSRDEFRNWILEPDEGVAMPSYEGRLTDEELERIIDFIMAAQTFPRRLR